MVCMPLLGEELNPIQLIHKYLHELELLRDKALTARRKLVEQYHYDVIHDYRIFVFKFVCKHEATGNKYFRNEFLIIEAHRKLLF